jgi:alkylhydroperoxidase family enzyme
MTKQDAWIHMVEEHEAEGELKEYYDQMKDPDSGEVDNILRIHGQHPATLHAHSVLYKTVMYGKSKIRRPEREMIAVVVSALNECHY